MRPLHDLNRPWPAMGDHALKLVAAAMRAAKTCRSLGIPARPFLYQNGAKAILNIGGMNVDGKQKSVDVGDDMAFTNTFARVASRSAGLGCRCSGCQSPLPLTGACAQASGRLAKLTR